MANKFERRALGIPSALRFLLNANDVGEDDGAGLGFVVEEGLQGVANGCFIMS